MRYFLTLSYRGTRYCGWQVQPNGLSVQTALENAVGTILRQPVEITGCGRTDTGVHARYYVAHFDAEGPLPDNLVHRLNGLLPDDIAVYSCRLMPPTAHARFDATERSYTYHIGLRKDPFATETAWYFSRHRSLDLGRMQDVADIFPRYSVFKPFCKTHSGVRSYACELRRAQWTVQPDEQQLVFGVSANRFLRGMVRLLVGACLEVGLGKLTVEEVEEALQTQRPLRKNLSVPPHGLFLANIHYPYPVADGMAPASFR